MAEAPSRSIVLFGTDQPVPEAVTLRAGPVSARFDTGNLRYLMVGEVEILRAVQFIVRDRNWGTYTPKIDNLTIDGDGETFRVAFDAVCADAEQRLSYRAVIEGRPDQISFRVLARPESAFVTNRTGFVVLHGVEGVAGEPVTVTHTDGSVENLRFPALIDPVQPLMDMRALAHEPAPGLTVKCTMTGDDYEMEDQRNWSDASYKTYIRPLARPWPYDLTAGAEMEQAVVVDITTPAAASATIIESPSIAVALAADDRRPLPKLGLAVSPETIDNDLAAVDLVRRIGAEHLVCHVDLRDHPGPDLLRRYGALCSATDTRMVLEVVLPFLDGDSAPSADPAVMYRDIDALRALTSEADVAPDSLIATPACDLKSTLPGSVFPNCPPSGAIHAALRQAFPNVTLGGGMLSYFTELNRKRPPTDAIDFISHTTCPIVHAGDDLSVMESLQALPSIMRSAQAMAGGLAYRIGPSAIGMRANPYGAGPAANPDNQRVAMARVDPRQRGLLAAAWTIGYWSRALAAGVDALCLNAPTGPFGAIHAPQDWAQPWFDAPDSAAKIYPVFHALAGIGAGSGDGIAVTSSAPSKLLGFAAGRANGGRDLWLANLTGDALTVDLRAIASPGRASVMDEANFTTLCANPEALSGVESSVVDGTLALGAYACARIEIPG